MRRLLLPLLLAGACHPASEERGEPVVRVHLRSLGDGPFEVTGKGGLVGARGPVRLGRQPRRLRAEGGVVLVNGHAYSGELQWTGAKLINRLPLENYVLGVLRGELPLKEVPVEAAGAQAIAVRSYTMHYLRQGRDEFDVDDTTTYQRYVGLAYAPQDAHLRAGVQATRGLYLELGGVPLKAYYHSTCGGHTTDVKTGLNREKPLPLHGVACEYCRRSKYWRWEGRLEAATVLQAAALRGPLERVAVADRGEGGRALRIRVDAGGRSRTLPAAEFRLRAGPSALRSTLIRDIETEPGGVVVRGAGWGHGVGLCQMGAIGQAFLGRSASEIVAYYYPGAKISRAY